MSSVAVMTTTEEIRKPRQAVKEAIMPRSDLQKFAAEVIAANCSRVEVRLGHTSTAADSTRWRNHYHTGRFYVRFAGVRGRSHSGKKIAHFYHPGQVTWVHTNSKHTQLEKHKEIQRAATACWMHLISYREQLCALLPRTIALVEVQPIDELSQAYWRTARREARFELAYKAN